MKGMHRILVVLGAITLSMLFGTGISADNRSHRSALALSGKPSSNLPGNNLIVFVNSLEESILNQVNQYRQTQNLPPLEFNETVSEQARAHSATMAKSDQLSHDGFENRWEAIRKVIAARGMAENVAFNKGHSQPDNIAVQGWIQSPGHHKNMIGNYNATGIGIVEKDGKYFFTQIFILKN
jgi:uncharacterized protein YkwD